MGVVAVFFPGFPENLATKSRFRGFPAPSSTGSVIEDSLGLGSHGAVLEGNGPYRKRIRKIKVSKQMRETIRQLSLEYEYMLMC